MELFHRAGVLRVMQCGSGPARSRGHGSGTREMRVRCGVTVASREGTAPRGGCRARLGSALDPSAEERGFPRASTRPLLEAPIPPQDHFRHPDKTPTCRRANGRPRSRPDSPPPGSAGWSNGAWRLAREGGERERTGAATPVAFGQSLRSFTTTAIVTGVGVSEGSGRSRVRCALGERARTSRVATLRVRLTRWSHGSTHQPLPRGYPAPSRRAQRARGSPPCQRRRSEMEGMTEPGQAHMRGPCGNEKKCRPDFPTPSLAPLPVFSSSGCGEKGGERSPGERTEH